MHRRTVSVAAFTAAAAGGAVLGFLGERRAVSGDVPADPEWAELRRGIPGRPRTVESYDGTGLHVEELGEAGAPTIVFAHGYGLSQQAWYYQRRDLADGFRLVLYDHRGHAGSEEAASGDYTVGALGRDLAAVLDACVPAGRRALVVGHSMGGMTVLSFADQFPELVERRLAGAVLIDTTGSDTLAGGVVGGGIAALSALEGLAGRGLRLLGRASPGRGRAGAAAAREAQADGPGEPGEQGPGEHGPGEHGPVGPGLAYPLTADVSRLLTRAMGLSASASPAQVAFTERLLLDCPTTVRAAFGPALSSFDLAHALRFLTVPTTVMVGCHVRLTPPSAARRLSDALPSAQLVELPGAGHMAPLEAHAAVSATIRGCAERLLRPDPGSRSGGREAGRR